MSTGVTTLTIAERRTLVVARLRDYLELTKPKIALMVLVTVAVGAFVAAWGPPEPWALLHALIGMALVAASGTALNQWLESASDARMHRTSDRPLPAGRLTGAETFGFGVIALIVGVIYLAYAVNVPAAVVAGISWFIYVVIYTPLKLLSPSNTVIGAVAGALPILVGWVAVGGQLNLMAWTLFLLVYLWQFPHFMAIAWIFRRDYSAAGMQMLTTVDPTGARAARLAVCGALVLLPVSLVPCSIAGAGWGYGTMVLLLGLAYLAAAIVFAIRRDDRSARWLMRVSLVYLPGVLLGVTLLPLV